MIEFAVDKAVKYFNTAIIRQQRKNNSKDCFIWLKYNTPEKVSVFVQLDENKESFAVENIKKLFNLYDEAEIAAFETVSNFNLNKEIADMFLNTSIAKSIPIEDMAVCIYNHDGITMAAVSIHDGETQISCETLRTLLMTETDDMEDDPMQSIDEESPDENDNGATNEVETETENN